MTGIGESTLAQPVKPPLRERRACLAKLVKNRLTLIIARMLATHNIAEVPLPDAAAEAARDLDRALDDATADYLRARQRLNMFLIRIGRVWDERNGVYVKQAMNKVARAI